MRSLLLITPLAFAIAALLGVPAATFTQNDVHIELVLYKGERGISDSLLRKHLSISQVGTDLKYQITEASSSSASSHLVIITHDPAQFCEQWLRDARALQHFTKLWEVRFTTLSAYVDVAQNSDGSPICTPTRTDAAATLQYTRSLPGRRVIIVTERLNQQQASALLQFPEIVQVDGGLPTVNSTPLLASQQSTPSGFGGNLQPIKLRCKGFAGFVSPNDPCLLATHTTEMSDAFYAGVLHVRKQKDAISAVMRDRLEYYDIHFTAPIENTTSAGNLDVCLTINSVQTGILEGYTITKDLNGAETRHPLYPRVVLHCAGSSHSHSSH